VTIARAFALGKFEVTVDQFAAFVKETGYDTGSTCDIWKDGTWEERQGYSWRNPGFAQGGSHPAACLSWDDAKAYLAWLSRKTGKEYRLPTEAEWEYAARAGSGGKFHFGDDVADYCRYGNGADQAARAEVPGAREKWTVLACSDGHAYTARVGSFAANAFGIYDMLGNVFEWVEDCWHDSYAGAPADGSAWVAAGDCAVRVQRGGAWATRRITCGWRCAAGRPRGTGTSTLACGWRGRSGGEISSQARCSRPCQMRSTMTSSASTKWA
jgi:formylglycine-generating enzyme required for sulfatase activity